MIMTCNLKCTTCKTVVTTRSALGQGDYQEFAYACPGCGIEIRYGMNLLLNKRIQEAQSRAKSDKDFTNRMHKIANMRNVEYVNLKNCDVAENKENSTKVLTLDGDYLVPLSGMDFSPFMALPRMPLNPQKYLAHQDGRRSGVKRIWPEIKRLIVHAERHHWDLFDEQFKTLELGEIPKSEAERKRAIFWVTELYGRMFSSDAPDVRTRINQRIALASNTSTSLTKQLVSYFQDIQKDELIIRELNAIRDMWGKVYSSLAPVFACLYWNGKRPESLDSYTLARKRFDELKPLYVDCLETFCRISVIAGGLEGIILNNALGVPSSKRVLSLAQFDVETKNGSKADILKGLPIGDLFTPFIDHNLRNGIGHHSAHYSVATDLIDYVTENKNGRKQHSISYIRFCEKVVRLYGQLEAVSTYAHWLRMQTLGI
jgi:hypothetical protein